MTPDTTVFLLCDIQTKFRPVISGYEHVVATANKMIKIAKLLGIPVIATTQKAKGLGPTDPAIDVESLGDLLLGTYDKTLFSMLTPDVSALLAARPNIDTVVLFGIESHVCVLQTTLALLALGKHKVYIVADGVSSTNSFEVPIAISRMRQEGAIISTSESISFELVKDASSPTFKPFSNLVKEFKDSTKANGDALLQGKL